MSMNRRDFVESALIAASAALAAGPGKVFAQEESTARKVGPNDKLRVATIEVADAEQAAAWLRQQGVPVRDLIVNRVEQEHDDCEYCRARVQTQRPWMKQIAKSFGDLELHYVPLVAKEVRGIHDLKQIGKLIWDEHTPKRS